MKRLLVERWFLVSLVGLVGLALLAPGPLAAASRPFDPRIVIAAALAIMAWTMPTRTLGDEVRRPWGAFAAFFVSYGPLPAAGWLLGDLIGPADLRVGFMLACSVPCTLASCILWTRLAGGNEATALLSVLVITASSPLVVPLWLAWTLGAAVHLSAGALMLDLSATVVVPMIVGQALRRIERLRHFADRRKPWLSGIAQLFILTTVVRAASAMGLRLSSEDAGIGAGAFVVCGAAAMALHLAALVGGLGACRGLGMDRARAIAVGFCGSQKTLPVSIALFDQYFKEAYPLAMVPLVFFHVGQLLLDTAVAERLKKPTLP